MVGGIPAGELKLNIGCGTSGLPGWVNIDNSPTILLARLPWGKKIFRTPDWPRDVRRMDVRKRLPFPDSSVSYIYTSHVFHQFSYDESLTIARESFRVLRVGGVIRIVVPDLALRVRNYLAATDDPMASHHLVMPFLPAMGIRDIVHPGTNLRQMFDARSLTHVLKQAGFASPEVSSFGTSRIPEVDKLDLEVRRRESLYVEAVR